MRVHYFFGEVFTRQLSRRSWYSGHSIAQNLIRSRVMFPIFVQASALLGRVPLFCRFSENGRLPTSKVVVLLFLTVSPRMNLNRKLGFLITAGATSVINQSKRPF